MDKKEFTTEKERLEREIELAAAEIYVRRHEVDVMEAELTLLKAKWMESRARSRYERITAALPGGHIELVEARCPLEKAHHPFDF